MGLRAASTEGPTFLPVEIVGRARNDAMPPVAEPASATGTIEIDFAGGHRMRITGGYDPEALTRLIRGLSA